MCGGLPERVGGRDVGRGEQAIGGGFVTGEGREGVVGGEGGEEDVAGTVAGLVVGWRVAEGGEQEAYMFWRGSVGER